MQKSVPVVRRCGDATQVEDVCTLAAITAAFERAADEDDPSYSFDDDGIVAKLLNPANAGHIRALLAGLKIEPIPVDTTAHRTMVHTSPRLPHFFIPPLFLCVHDFRFLKTQPACVPDKSETPYMCDVCGNAADRCGTGGACIRERDGTNTFACRDCEVLYLDITAAERRRRYGGYIHDLETTMAAMAEQTLSERSKFHRRKVSFALHCACNLACLALTTRFSRTVPFSHSIAAITKLTECTQSPDTYSVSVILGNTDQTGRIDPNLFHHVDIPRSRCPDHLVPHYHCWGCHISVRVDRILKCQRCGVAGYCGDRCMRKHADMHEPCCRHVAGNVTGNVTAAPPTTTTATKARKPRQKRGNANRKNGHNK